MTNSFDGLDKNSKKLEKDCELDCIIRDSAIKALDYDIEHFEFKPGVSKHMDDIAKLLNTIYEIQANNIKALPSVIPQKSEWEHDHEILRAYSDGANQVIDMIRAEIEKAVWEDCIYSRDGADEVRIPRLDPDDVFAILDKYKAGSEEV